MGKPNVRVSERLKQLEEEFIGLAGIALSEHVNNRKSLDADRLAYFREFYFLLLDSAREYDQQYLELSNGQISGNYVRCCQSIHKALDYIDEEMRKRKIPIPAERKPRVFRLREN